MLQFHSCTTVGAPLSVSFGVAHLAMKSMRAKVLKIAGCVLGAGLLYFLSVGPMLRLSVDTRFESFADRFYSPLLDSGDTVAWPVVRWYLRLWDLYHPISDSLPLPRPK